MTHGLYVLLTVQKVRKSMLNIDDAAQCYACLQSWGAMSSKSSERAGLSKLSRP